MRAHVVLAVLAFGCGKRAPSGEPAQVVDLSGSVDELRRDFDAHRDEPRFVTLIAPS